MKHKSTLEFHNYLSLLIGFIVLVKTCNALLHYPHQRERSTSYQKTTCIHYEDVLKAHHKSCFLRPDTGPCRADLIQWYFDAQDNKCYRFFWGGCQGNGNKFETQKECEDYCLLSELTKGQRPLFCSLTYDYGNCFGTIYRWAFDTIDKVCKRHIYSGCGGNKNNFKTKDQCQRVCDYNLQTTPNYNSTCMPYPVTYMFN